MKVVLPFLIVLGLLVVGGYFTLRDTKRRGKLNPPALAPSGEELQRVSMDMARLLETSLRDPMYRTTTQWEDRTKRLLNDYYGDE